MIVLTTPVNIPNVQRVKGSIPQIDEDSGTVILYVDLLGGGSRLYNRFQVAARNGSCQGVRVRAIPMDFSDYFEVFTVEKPTAYTDICAAFLAAAPNMGARVRAVEQKLLDLGLVPAGAVS